MYKVQKLAIDWKPFMITQCYSDQTKRYGNSKDLAGAVIGLLKNDSTTYDKIELSPDLKKDAVFMDTYYHMVGAYLTRTYGYEQRKEPVSAESELEAIAL